MTAGIVRIISVYESVFRKVIIIANADCETIVKKFHKNLRLNSGVGGGFGGTSIEIDDNGSLYCNTTTEEQ